MGRVDDVIELCCSLISIEESKKRDSFRAGGKVGSITIAAGTALDRIFVGVVGGAPLSYVLFKGEPKPVLQLLKEFSPQEKQELYDHLKDILENLQWKSCAHLLSLVVDQPIHEQIFEALNQFLTDK